MKEFASSPDASVLLAYGTLFLFGLLFVAGVVVPKAIEAIRFPVGFSEKQNRRTKTTPSNNQS